MIKEPMDEAVLIRGHHLPDLHIVALLGIDHPETTSLIATYTPSMLEEKLKTFRLLVDRPETFVKITSSLDYLCNARCPQKRESCSAKKAASVDTFAAQHKYGFVVGKTYTSHELFRSLEVKPYRSIGLYIPALGEEKSLLEQFRLRLQGIKVISRKY